VDQLEAMRVFVAISDAGSLTAAGRALGVPVAGVSRKLAALEAHLGTRLLSRSSRRMALTEAGRRYLETCRRVVAEIDAADHAAAGEPDEPQGLLSITASVLFGRMHVMPVVLDLLAAHPRLDVRLVFDDHDLDLIGAGLDAAVRIGTLRDSALVAMRVGSVRRIACASPAYLQARGTPSQPEELASHDCVAFDAPAGGAPGRWSFPSKRGLRSVAVRARLVVPSAEAAVEAAAAGLGVTRVLSYQVQAALAAGRVVPILERFEPPALPVHLLHGDGRTPRPKLRAFLALAAPRLRAVLRGTD